MTRSRSGAARLEYLGPASVIVPAHNAAATIAGRVRSLIGGDYPGIEVIVVDDGSTDGTADIVGALSLPGVLVIHAAGRGALDAGVRYALHDLLVLVDGNTVLEKDTIGRLLQPLRDPALGAVAGNARIAGSPGRRRPMSVPGAVAAFRRSAVQNVDGAAASDLVVAVARAGWRVAYEPTAVAWTEAPTSRRHLWRRRYRWHRATMRARLQHRRGAARSARRQATS